MRATPSSNYTGTCAGRPNNRASDGLHRRARSALPQSSRFSRWTKRHHQTTMGRWACRNHLGQSWSPPVPACSTAPSSSAVSRAARPSSAGAICGSASSSPPRVAKVRGVLRRARAALNARVLGHSQQAATRSALQHSGAANAWNRRDRVEARGCVLRLPKLTTNRSINESDLDAAKETAAKL